MSLLDGILGEARRRGLAKGVLGGNRVWLLVGGLAWGVRALQWALRPDPRTIYRRSLGEGQTLVISAVAPPPSRRRRRRQRKRDRKVAKQEARRERRALRS